MMDDYRFRAQQQQQQPAPRNEATMNSLMSPPRNGARMPQQHVPSQDHRTSLPRRFTTDSGRVPTLSSINTQRPPEPQEYPTALEKKKLEYEKIVEQRRRFEAEMQKLAAQQRLEEMELLRMQEDLGRGGALTGHLSEPTTPPEYRETSSGFPTMFSRPNRYSTSSLVSPQTMFNQRGRSGSQLTSPQSSVMPSRFGFDDQIPSRSVPGSRRNSDDDEKEEALRQDPTSHRSTNALNRYSMPVTRRGNLYDNIDQTNAAGFLFRDDDSGMEATYTAVDTGDNGFPKLYTQKPNPNRLSASSVAVDLSALETANGWNKMPSMHRHQQSLSQLSSTQMNSNDNGQGGEGSDAKNIGARSGFRHSLDLKNHNMDMGYYKDAVAEATASSAAPLMSPPAAQVLTTPPKLQTSFSANDIPTVKNPLHFHNHNASIGRIPPGAYSKRHSRELSGDSGHIAVTQSATFPSIGSALHANAPSFGPPATQAQLQSTPSSASVSSPGSSMGSYPSFFPGGYNPASPNGPNGPNAHHGPHGSNGPHGHNGPGYNMNMLTMGMNNMNMNGYPGQAYTGYAPMYQSGPTNNRDSQQRVINQRRAVDNEGKYPPMSRFNNLTLDDLVGEIFALCKDQHGCRFLQKQLENRNPGEIRQIWRETSPHVTELMMDPFGNYLCQKLLEYCTDDERTTLIQNASAQMVRIALNQHGTRALQKMIEFVSIPEHVQLIVNALRYQVVDLIQDLNGNHVIQKCLNKLSAEDAQFIFDAVGNHCIDVGTHRHGCCVLQRCIDHASGDQKSWLVARITDNALRLVQDPFGNYVVQYIIDLNEPSFTEPLVRQFGTKIGMLSRHKFSSNVIEKCLRCASEPSRDNMCQEMLNSGEMEKMLRDSFGNYVVQTALEHATPQMKHNLVESIRPILPGIRSTPYGRRLQAKIQAHDARSGSNPSSGQTTPADQTGGQISLRAARTMGNGTMPSGGYANGMNGARGQAAYPAGSALTVPPPQPPRLNQGFTYPGASMQTGNGDGHFF
ncbi:ARM repeat-containing protein [Apiospora hydei]|uniref:ARM repeat-containing protein n=1 Tax=Apiospora hydei TaxID=1337664 RepID=A0ABR1XAZ2_9PEZI